MVSVSLVFSFPASVKIPDAARYRWRVNTVDALAMAKSRSWNITSGTTTHLHNTGCRIFGDPLCYDWRLKDGLIRLLASFHAAPWGEKRTMIWWLGLARCYLTNPSAIVTHTQWMLVSGEPMIGRFSLDQQVTVAVWETEQPRVEIYCMQIDKV